MKTNSLYSLIKEQKEKKLFPLKVVSDWDECLFSFRPTLIYKFGDINKTFGEFFNEFWEKAEVTTDKDDGSKKFIYDGVDGAKIAYERFKKLSDERLKDSNKYDDKYKWLDVVEDMSFLTIAEDLLKCLKEELISELVIITTTRNEKSMVNDSRMKRFSNSFSKFSQCKLSIIFVKKIDGENRPYRWEWIKENHPDFDIFIDDDSWLIESVKKNFPKDKIYVIPDYKCNLYLQGNNIYHVKQEVSDITDNKFVKKSLVKIDSFYANSKKERRESWEESSFKKKKKDISWTNISYSFINKELIEKWLSNNFTFEEVEKWANVQGEKFDPLEINFYIWLRDNRKLTPQQCLDFHHNLVELQTEFQLQQLQSQIQIIHEK